MEIVRYQAGGVEVTLSPQIIRDYLCSDKSVTNQEIMMFLRLCEAQRLNPFLREAYLVKFTGSPAQYIVGKEALTKRAASQPSFRGYSAGVVVKLENGNIERREGSLVAPGETLLGGWCDTRKEGWDVPIRAEVSLAEYSTGKSMWLRMPATMIRKVALNHSLREAYPDSCAGLYGAEEMGLTYELPETPVSQPISTERYLGQIDGTGREQPALEVEATLSKAQAEEIWRVLKGDATLAAEMHKRTGKTIEDINPRAFNKALRIAQELAEAVYGVSTGEQPQDLSGEVGEPPEPILISPGQYDELYASIESYENSAQIEDYIIDLFHISKLPLLSAADFETAMSLIKEMGRVY
ncbi:MAG: phage recombination protein Bet [Symbiobacteriaceae bacterium]|nr:phage recombination protein Bet [Symbiobacteriaceae bacterium]